MKKIISVTLASVMLLSFVACGIPGMDGGAEGTSSEKESDIISSEQNANDPANGDGSGENGLVTEPETEKLQRPVPLQIMVGTEYEYEYDETDGYRLLCRAEWDLLRLGEESAANYPLLEAALSELRVSDRSYYGEFATEMLPYAQEQAALSEYFYEYTATSKCAVVRADDRILSVQIDADEYTGGAHPNYGVTGLNLDPETGERVALEEVLTDTTQLPAILAEKIRAKYPDEPLENLQTQLEEYTPQMYTWTLDYQGITFFFSPYEVASYAAGLLNTTIWFDEMPELFREEYTLAPAGGWVEMLPLNRENETDLNAPGGEKSSLYFWLTEDEYDYKQIYLKWNDTDIHFEECYGFEMLPMLVCAGEPGNERYYLYIEASAENEYTTMYIYDLNGTEPVKREEVSGVSRSGWWDENEGEYGMYYDMVLNDPTEYMLSSIVHILGTWSAGRHYMTDPETGKILLLEGDYTIPEGDRTLVSTVDLEICILPGNEPEILPAGTVFYPMQTDGEQYMICGLEDGRQCRIDVEREDYQWMVNGISEWDCFEELLYAG